MIRLIIFGVIGLLVGLGGGTGIAMMGAKKAHIADSTVVATRLKTHRDSVEADSVATQAAKDSVAAADSAAHAAAPAPATPTSTPAAAGHDAATAHTPPTTTTVPNPGPQLPQLPKPPSPSTRQIVEGTVTAGKDAVPTMPGAVSPTRIAKIFAAMPARDASRVMQDLSDDDVRMILGAMNDRQAAAILAGFPADRVARISRAAIHGTKGTQ